MQNSITLTTKWSKSILWEFRWNSPQELFSFLMTVDDSVIASYNLSVKSELITSLRKAILQVEISGDQNKETREMTSPGALFESMSFDQLQIRADYMLKRKRLRAQLKSIGKLRSGRVNILQKDAANQHRKDGSDDF